jgi:hypothetical protein
MCPPKVPKNAQSRVKADYYWETFEVPNRIAPGAEAVALVAGPDRRIHHRPQG